MIIGIGADILRMDRIIEFHEDDVDVFFTKTFTSKEIQLSESRSNKRAYYASRFAGKEAIFKCFGVDGNRITLLDIEILNDDVGKPYVNLYGKLKAIAETKQIDQIELSLSYEDEFALAFAVAHKCST